MKTTNICPDCGTVISRGGIRCARCATRRTRRWADARARDAAIHGLLAEGVRQVEVARRLGVSRQRVGQIVKRLPKG